MSNNVSPTVVQGGVNKVDTTNATVEELLAMVVERLDIIILHQECTTDENFNPEDIEENYYDSN